MSLLRSFSLLVSMRWQPESWVGAHLQCVKRMNMIKETTTLGQKIAISIFAEVRTRRHRASDYTLPPLP